MIEVLPGDPRGRLVTDGEPRLRAMALVEIVRRAWTAHPGRDPSRLQRIRRHAGPAPRHCECQQHVVQLALAIGLRNGPRAPAPLQIIEMRAHATVHAGAEINQPRRPLDQRGQHLGRQRVDGEQMPQSVRRGLVPFAVADRHVMDHGVATADFAHLLGDAAHLGDRRDIADRHALGLRQSRPRLGRRRGVARMQYDLVALLGQQLPGHQAEPLRRSGNKNPRHPAMNSACKDDAIRQTQAKL